MRKHKELINIIMEIKEDHKDKCTELDRNLVKSADAYLHSLKHSFYDGVFQDVINGSNIPKIEVEDIIFNMIIGNMSTRNLGVMNAKEFEAANTILGIIDLKMFDGKLILSFDKDNIERETMAAVECNKEVLELFVLKQILGIDI